MGNQNDQSLPPEDEFLSFLTSLRARFDAEPTEHLLGLGSAEKLLTSDSTEVPQPSPDAASSEQLLEQESESLHLVLRTMRWSRLLGECVLGFGLLIALELLCGSGIGSLGVSPHPYWLLILPIAASRGFVAGLCAAVIGGVLYFIGAWAHVDLSHWTQLVTEHSSVPLGFCLAAFLVGQVSDAFSARYRELWRRFRRDHAERQKAMQRLAEVLGSNRDLKLRLLDHSAQFGHLLGAAKRLETASPQELFELTLDMVVEHCSAQRCSVLQWRANRVTAVAVRGWQEHEVHEMTRLAGSLKQVEAGFDDGSRFNAFVADPGARGPLLMTPLHNEDGTVEALLCLDSLPAERYHAGLASIFYGIGEWSQVVLQRFASGEDVVPKAGQSMGQHTSWIGSRTELSRRMWIESARVERGLACTVIAVHVRGTGPWSRADQDKLDQLLEATLLNGVLRNSDSIYRLGVTGAWVVVLPATPCEGGKIVQQRLIAFLASLRFGRVHSFQVERFTSDTDTSGPFTAIDAVDAWVALRNDSEMLAPLKDLAPQQHIVGDAVELCRRLSDECHLAARREDVLLVLQMQVDPVHVRSQFETRQTLTDLASELLDPSASVHELESGNYTVLLTHADGAEQFLLGRQFASEFARRLGGGRAIPLHRRIMATGGGAEEQSALLALVLGRRFKAAEPVHVEEEALA